jgi:transposase
MKEATANIDDKAELEKAHLIIEKQDLTIQALQLEVRQLKKMIFGSKQEKFIASQQANIPQLFDVAPLADIITTDTKTITYEKSKKELRPNHKGRNSFPESLRREEKVIYPEGIDPEQIDPAIHKIIGKDITETLAYKSAELYIKANTRLRILDTRANRILQAPAPERSFERSNVDSSLVAQIITEKYIDHIPLDRQLKRYGRLGVEISDSSVGGWIKTAAEWMLPLYNAHQKEVLATRYLHADETIIRVMDSAKKGATHQGYYWVYQCHDKKLVLFDYRPGRGREGPQSILKDFQGYLQTDGYQVYDEFGTQPGIRLINCMAHARRKFNEALSNNDKAAYVLTEIQKLYAIERHLENNNITGPEKLQYRIENAQPILKQLGDWMKQAYTEVLPSSAFGKALAYSITRWEKLSLYATTDNLHLDNNPVENSIRPVAVGRKNYLFAGSHAAAQRAAMFYSLLATCKNYKINPYHWLHDILERIAAHPVNSIPELLPQNWKPTT